jgi:hypothetical protein
MVAGQVSNFTGASALLSSLPSADYLLAARDNEVGGFGTELTSDRIKLISGRTSYGTPITQDKHRYKGRSWIENMFGTPNDAPQI